MATLQASSLPLSGSSSSSICCRRADIKAAINAPKIRITPLSLPNLSKTGLMEEISLKSRIPIISTTQLEKDSNSSDPMVIAKLYAIMEAVADRVEMHKNIGEQRDNWNHLLLNSINFMTLAASTMCGLAATNPAFKVSSAILYLAATGLLAIMNSIQPSQLAEEQRNATRLFKKLHAQIQTMLSIGNPSTNDVNEAMEKVLALDRAFPLPLLGTMLEKFPSSVKPAVWWPQKRTMQAKGLNRITDENGWSEELEDEMKKIVGVLKRKDKEDYLKLGRQALKFNKVLAICGPLLTGLGAVGSVFVGVNNPWAVMMGVACGALASIVNTMEHGGQVGMVFEMYRNNAGFFKLMEESIESNLKETMVEGRENGEMLKLKVALQLGRSLSELEDLQASSSSEEFASKLF